MADLSAPDPFVTLRAPVVPTTPDAGFAARLRVRLEEALRLPEGVDVTVTTLEDLETRPPRPPAEARMVLTPYLAVADARRAIDWYGEAFGARLRGDPVVMPDGRIGHTELELGGALVMLADEFPAIGHAAPHPGGGSSVTLHLEAADIDDLVVRAVATGAVLDRPPEDHPYGRNAVVIDPFGHRWLLSTPAPTPADDQARHRRGTRHGDVGYVSFEVPDVERAQAFYGAVLGWAFAPAERPDARRVVDSAPLTSLWGGQERGNPVLCWQVDDIVVAVDTVRDMGGTATDPEERPYGTTADCADDQGMVFYLWQPPADDTRAGGDRPGNGAKQGDVAYLALNVVDSTRFKDFFGELLGWRFTPGRVADGWNVEGTVPMAGLAGGADRASVVPMFRVDDVEAAVRRVRAAGGTATAVERMPYGLTSDCTDDQGTPFYLGQL
jgi:predicted enzyme related to lactoylglutathione lyase